MNQENLLNLLRSDARLTDAELAARLGAEAAEVAAARARMEEEGRIVGYQTIFNDDTKGGVSAFIEVRCSPERGGGFNRLAQRIARFNEVKSCYLISGGYDLLILIEESTLLDVARFVSEKLSSMEGVLSTATHFRLKTYKKHGLLIEEDATHERLSVAP